MPLMPMMPKSTLNWRMKSMVVSPTMPRSRLRTTPPATITSKSRILAEDAGHLQIVGDDAQAAMAQQRRATSSVVVPMLMNSEASSGMCRGDQLGDAPLLLEAHDLPVG